MTSFRCVLLAVFAAGLLAPIAGAQVTSTDDVTSVPATKAEAPMEATRVAEQATASPAADRPLGPRMEAATVGPRAVDATRDARPEHSLGQQQGQFGRAETLMIVGGAAFIAGLLIGDDAGTVVMVGGAAVGLYGLYLYLQQQ